MEAGWLVTEWGRQPWIVRGLMRTAEALTPFRPLGPPFLTFTLVYLLLGAIVVYLLYRQVQAPSAPDRRTRPPPHPARAAVPAPELVLAGAMVAALILYFLFGGADFGGGVWDLLAAGPRRAAQRETIERAIGPIWEANHVWLILVVVVLFTGFPPVFAALSIALHVPLTLFLLGIVFRGSSFAFRSFDPGRGQKRYGLAFSIASLVSPLLLGMVVGATASGQIDVSGGQ